MCVSGVCSVALGVCEWDVQRVATLGTVSLECGFVQWFAMDTNNHTAAEYNKESRRKLDQISRVSL